VCCGDGGCIEGSGKGKEKGWIQHIGAIEGKQKGIFGRTGGKADSMKGMIIWYTNKLPLVWGGNLKKKS